MRSRGRRLNGNLKDFPLPDLLAAFEAERKSGVLRLRQGTAEGVQRGEIVLLDGRVIGAALYRAGVSRGMGDALVDEALCSPEDAAGAADYAVMVRPPVAGSLREGAERVGVPYERVVEVLREHVRSVTKQMWSWRSGQWELLLEGFPEEAERDSAAARAFLLDDGMEAAEIGPIPPPRAVITAPPSGTTAARAAAAQAVADARNAAASAPMFAAPPIEPPPASGDDDLWPSESAEDLEPTMPPPSDDWDAAERAAADQAAADHDAAQRAEEARLSAEAAAQEAEEELRRKREERERAAAEEKAAAEKAAAEKTAAEKKAAADKAAAEKAAADRKAAAERAAAQKAAAEKAASEKAAAEKAAAERQAQEEREAAERAAAEAAASAPPEEPVAWEPSEAATDEAEAAGGANGNGHANGNGADHDEANGNGMLPGEAALMEADQLLDGEVLQVMLEMGTSAAAAAERAATPEVLATGHVVLVDEDGSLAQLLLPALREAGYRVHAVQGLTGGRRKLEEAATSGEAPLFLVDLFLKRDDDEGITGGLTLAEIASRLDTPPPVVLLAEPTGGDLAQQASAAGVRVVVERPTRGELKSDESARLTFLGRLLEAIDDHRPKMEWSEHAAADEPWEEGAGKPPSEWDVERIEETAATIEDLPDLPEDPAARLEALWRETLHQLSSPLSKPEILLQILRFGAEVLTRGVLFTVDKKGQLIGFGQFGVDLGADLDADEAVRKIRMPADAHPGIASAVDGRVAMRVQPGDSPWETNLFEALGAARPVECFYGPVFCQGRLAAVLYGDMVALGPGGSPESAESEHVPDTTTLEVVLGQAGLALDRSELEARIRTLEGKG